MQFVVQERQHPTSKTAKFDFVSIQNITAWHVEQFGTAFPPMPSGWQKIRVTVR